MNAIRDASEYGFNHARFHELEPGVPDAARYDGWTPDSQKRFLIAISRGLNITKACMIVGLSRQSAYAFRASARGAAFALAWDAAHIRARDVLADELMDRAFNGVTDSVKHDNGTNITRHRHDNNLAFKMLARLDKRADAACTDTGATAARMCAADFEQMLDVIARDGGPARAGLFLAARVGEAAKQATEADLAPIRALARADRWLLTNTDLGQGIDTSDLDPAARASWTGEQWARAEAAGLVQLAPPPPELSTEPETASNRQDCQPPAFVDPDNPDDQPVWWDSRDEQWRTRFPPSDDFCGQEDGDYGDPGYSRTLDDDEAEVMDVLEEEAVAATLPAATADRDGWFAARRAELAAMRAAPDLIPVDPAAANLDAAHALPASTARLAPVQEDSA
ncbi:hypothetical protein [Sphingomonas sp. LT1P40]|uniref:hypothetical protein n=1 Tax=Alteristakelama amylovorans TaxID=3096166 RepID=UPI002FC58C5C